MRGDVLALSAGGTDLVVVHCPGASTTSVVATFGRGFGQDPANAAGVAHLHEHLYLRTLQQTMTAPVVAQAETRSHTMRLTATTLAGSEDSLAAALSETSQALACGGASPVARVRECRRIDIEISEWSGNPLLSVGYKLAAVVAGQPELARFDECRIGDSARINAGELHAHAAQPVMTRPHRLVVAGPRPPEQWPPMLAALAGAGGGTPARPTARGDGRPLERPMSAGWSCQNRVYVGVPLWLMGAHAAEATYVAAQALLHERGPLAEIGACVGARFRGGSIIRGKQVAVVTGSWLVDNDRQREAIGAAVSEHSGAPGLALLTQLAESAKAGPPDSGITALASAVDAWQDGFGADPCAERPPSPDQIAAVLRRGWPLATVVGAGLARLGPF